MLGAITRWLFKMWGWQIVGPIPHDVPKAIWVVAPHTTNWDFPIGLGIRPTIHIWIEFTAKKELFTPAIGWLFRALGGRPVERSRNTNFVDAVAETFNRADRLHVCVAPEGTRSNVKKLKTGFYYMALKANVPLILTGFDWPRKLVVLSEPMFMTGDYERDMLPVYEFFSHVQGKKKDWLLDWERTGIIEKP
jgi:1-acyl-sn-glycerol-3-phosphate acyltransferase